MPPDLLDEVAADIGRLRQRFAANGGWTGIYLVDRAADTLEMLDCLRTPSAADLYRDYLAISGDEDMALTEALHVTAKRQRQFRQLLRDPAVPTGDEVAVGARRGRVQIVRKAAA